ncbi:PIG-L family deacetylase [Knoellia sp. CPCC 206453]|uniref:PIG-L family deacetylase n=1 Tax=Knoellia pratensis TaxID=3404796 RepID=UPI00361C0924
MSPRTGTLHHPEGEPRWVRDERWSTLRRPTTATLLAPYNHLLVVAAHPDDECLGAGAFIADAACLGLDVTVLVLTDGEGSHPRSPTVTPSQLASMRSAEADRAAAVLAPCARVIHAGLADGTLPSYLAESVAAIQDLIRPGTFVLAPWTADGHPDHDAAGQAATQAVASPAPTQDGSQGPDGPVGLAHYMVWLWHWGAPDDLPWAESVVVDATLEGLSASDRALDEHLTQRQPLSPAVGDELLLTEAVMAPFRRGFTTLVLAAVGSGADRSRAPEPDQVTHGQVAGEPLGQTFDAMFADSDDPWSSESWYERRKRALCLATLGRERYDRVLDIGCSTGALTAALGDRADAVVAIDVSARALAIASSRGAHGISWLQGVAPEVLEDVEGTFDLVVLSEVGYFLKPFDLWLTLAAVLERLEPGGELLVVHWRRPTKHIPSDGPAVHGQIRAVCERWATSSHAEADFLADTYAVSR